jgi:hypothetical protein
MKLKSCSRRWWRHHIERGINGRRVEEQLRVRQDRGAPIVMTLEAPSDTRPYQWE